MIRTLFSILIISFISAPVLGGSVDGKGIYCEGIKEGFWFEDDKVFVYEIQGYDVVLRLRREYKGLDEKTIF